MIKFKTKSTFFGGLPVRLMTTYGGETVNTINYNADNMCNALGIMLRGLMVIIFGVAVSAFLLAVIASPILVWLTWMAVNMTYIQPSEWLMVSFFIMAIGAIAFVSILLLEKIKSMASPDKLDRDSNAYKMYRAYREKYCVGVEFE